MTPNLHDRKDEELDRMLAELVGCDEWVILKRGSYYRPNGHGYTASLAEAWKLPHAEAKKHEMYVDRKDVDHCDKVFIERAPTPRYTQSLDECARVEAGLKGDAIQNKYISEIAAICWEDQERADNQVIFNQLTASARQRTIALISTLQAKP